MKWEIFGEKSVRARGNPQDYIDKLGWNTEKMYPIPPEYKTIVRYCKIIYDTSKAFYYDKDFNFVCEVDKKIL